MTKQSNEVVVKFHKGQAPIWLSDSKYTFIISGTGGGKTYFGRFWLLNEMSKCEGESFLVVSPSYKMTTRNLLQELMELLQKAYPQGKYHKQDNAWISNKHTVWFGTADNPQSMEGAHVKACWLDECGMMSIYAWEVAKRRVGYKQGRILGTTTPYYHNWLKTEVYDRFIAGDKDYLISQFESITNPYYPREEYERAKATLPLWKFQMFYQGKFTRPEGLIYDLKAESMIEPFEIPKEWEKWIGLDFGYNNPMAMVFMAEDNDGGWYLYDEYYKSGILINELANVIRRSGVKSVYADPSGKQTLEELKNLLINDGVVFESTDSGVMSGIMRVSERINTNRLKIFRGNKYFIDEIESYMWKVVNDKITEEPVKEKDHLMDALRYAANKGRSKEVERKIIFNTMSLIDIEY